MKVTLTIFALLLCSVVATLGQSKKDIFDREVPIVWLGIDFTGAKIIGDRGRLATQSDLLKLMESLNDLMRTEAEKYDVGKALKRKHAEMDLEVTKVHNAGLKVNDLFSVEESDYLKLSLNDIHAIVQDYDFKNHTGLGVMINVGSFSKNEQKAVLYFTIVNMDSKEVLLSQRYIEKPVGLSIRNYWAATIHEVIEKVKVKDYPAWKKEAKI